MLQSHKVAIFQYSNIVWRILVVRLNQPLIVFVFMRVGGYLRTIFTSVALSLFTEKKSSIKPVADERQPPSDRDDNVNVNSRRRFYDSSELQPLHMQPVWACWHCARNCQPNTIEMLNCKSRHRCRFCSERLSVCKRTTCTGRLAIVSGQSLWQAVA